MPSLTGVLETSIYVDDLDRASRFYEELFQLPRIYEDDRLRAYSIAAKDVLLIFKRGASIRGVELPIGKMGSHDGSGPLHLAFSIATEDLPAWEELLGKRQIPIESRIHWLRGGVSIYFRDPDNHLLELATPGLWSIY